MLVHRRDVPATLPLSRLSRIDINSLVFCFLALPIPRNAEAPNHSPFKLSFLFARMLYADFLYQADTGSAHIYILLSVSCYHMFDSRPRLGGRGIV